MTSTVILKRACGWIFSLVPEPTVTYLSLVRLEQQQHMWLTRDMQMKREVPHFKFGVGHLNELKIHAHVGMHVGVFGFVKFGCFFGAHLKFNP